MKKKLGVQYLYLKLTLSAKWKCSDFAYKALNAKIIVNLQLT